MNWLTHRIFLWLWPWFGPALDYCNKKNLEQYYKNQREFQQESSAHILRINDWIEQCNKSMRTEDERHKEKMQMFERLISALNK